MLPCSQSIYRSILGPLVNWCLDTFGEDAPVLIGVHLGPEHMQLHHTELSIVDPIRDLASRRASDDWDVVIVVLETARIDGLPHSGVVAHAMDRHGQSATVLDEQCGRRRPLRHPSGWLHRVTLSLFDVF